MTVEIKKQPIHLIMSVDDGRKLMFALERIFGHEALFPPNDLEALSKFYDLLMGFKVNKKK